VHRIARDTGQFGTRTSGVALDWPAVIARQHAIVARFRPSPDALEAKGARVYLGHATFRDAHTVRVGDRDLRGERIIIAAGSAPVIPDVAGASLGITSDDLLFLEDLPRRLVLVGGGVIALEMAGAFADFGAEVAVLARESEILSRFDTDVAAYVRRALEARGITFHLNADVTALVGTRSAVTVRFTAGGAAHELPADAACFATGRRFRPHLLGAESLGLEVGPLGLRTSEHLRTSLPHIYAAGDAAGNMQLTPTAAYEGRLAAHNALGVDPGAVDLSIVPQTVFTTPEVARVGLSHADAKRRGVACHVAAHDMRGASNGVASGEDDGYLKLVFEHGSERLLGVQVVSHAAGEIIQLAALALRTGTTAGRLAAQIAVHPTHAERFIKVAAHEYHEICEV
jgi:glutathione reductase (NADPH)